jgi:hypothetical protein
MKRLLVTQSNYIPWKGYFDAIASVDEFVILDTVQYTRRDWRNRNQIKTAQGPQWLTVPVEVSGRYHQRINEVVVADPDWSRQHWDRIVHAYGKAPFFNEVRSRFETLYHDGLPERLTEINQCLIGAVCAALDISTPVLRAEDIPASDDKTRRLLDICLARGATDYYSGPSARGYLDETLFRHHGVNVHYFNFSGYAEYRQLHPPFTHHVTVLDLLSNEGDNAKTLFRSRQLIPSTVSLQGINP